MTGQPDDQLDQHRQRALDELDQIQQVLQSIADSTHYLIGPDGVILDPATGKPLHDKIQNLQALDAIAQVNASRRRLLGLDPPKRHTLIVPTGTSPGAIRAAAEQLAITDWAASQDQDDGTLEP
jgi:hypothetical protein